MRWDIVCMVQLSGLYATCMRPAQPYTRKAANSSTHYFFPSFLIMSTVSTLDQQLKQVLNSCPSARQITLRGKSLFPYFPGSVYIRHVIFSRHAQHHIFVMYRGSGSSDLIGRLDSEDSSDSTGCLDLEDLSNSKG